MITVGGTIAYWLVSWISISSVPGLSPGWGTALCSWARHFTPTVSLLAQKYKWVPVNCWGNLSEYWGVTCDGLASHPEGTVTLLAASYYRNPKLRAGS